MTDAPASFPAAAIDARALTLERGGRLIARDLSIAAGPGEAVVLTGPNGAGKTTLLRALAGLIRPEAGHVETTPAEGAIALLGHADALKPGETVDAALAFWGRLHGAEPGAIETATRAFAVAHLGPRACGTLSAGQRRRVALARVMISNRPIWLLDEPAAPLDARGRDLLARAAADHRAPGGLIVATTHADLGWPDARIVELVHEAAA